MTQEQNELAALSQAMKSTLERKRRLGLRRAGLGPSIPQTEQPAAQAVAAPEQTPQASPAKAQPAVAKTSAPETLASRAQGCLNLDQLAQVASQCKACSLHEGRNRPVFSDGNPQPGGILFLGEAPSHVDNGSGTPFSGPPGQLLTDIIVKGMGLSRQQVTITQLVKCPTPGGRPASKEELETCAPIFRRQLELVNPRVLVPLGERPANFLLTRNSPLADLRNQVFDLAGRKVVPTFHPGELLQDPAKKRGCWSDIQRAMAAAGVKKRP